MAGGKWPDWKDWSSPRQVYLDTNATCNLKCIQCDIHLLRHPPNELTLDERKSLIESLGRWDKRIKLHFSGGEPFLRRQEVYALAQTARESGLFLGVNTNGTLFKPDDFPKLPHSGISTLVFSLDSHRPEVHDGIRGVKGTFERIREAIRETVEERQRQSGPMQLLLSSILGSHNLGDCAGLFQLVDEWELDGIIFQPVQPIFERHIAENWWENTPLWPLDSTQVHTGIDELIALKASGGKTYQNRKAFEGFRHYFLENGKVSQGHCTSMRDQLMVDGVGDVRFCFSQDRLREPVLGNVREKGIDQIWRESLAIRKKYDGCALECGAMLCHGK